MRARLFEKGAQSMRAHFDFPPWTMGSSGDAHHPFARAVGGIFWLRPNAVISHRIFFIFNIWSSNKSYF
jgi:hypothetical protein